ncbi:MAG: hypothetical protein GX195_08945 [Firmicutes bacterium]|jgi:alanyl-tRNA synthetase|nr:hypothetical protein [Bacillota bacterium]
MLKYTYYTDPFLTEFQTEVEAVKSVAGQYHVVLKDTIFYPTGGGQPHDTGWIDGARVLDVFEEAGQAVHVVDRPLTQGPVELRLDWGRRFYYMQHHTGQHLLSAVFANTYGWETRGFHLGENYTTIDITAAEMDEDVLGAVEQKVNELIYEDLPVVIHLTSPEEAAKLPLRKAPTVSSDIRIVEIAGYDYSPCGGTHLRSTGQIGILKIMKAEKYKGMTRVYFLCGKRALSDYGEKHRLIVEVSALLSTAVPELAAKVKADLELRRDLEAQLAEVQSRLWQYQAKELTAAAQHRFIYHVLGGNSVEEAQALARHITAQGPYFAAIEAGSRLVIAQSLGEEPHCGKLIKEHALPLGGKGGGSAQLAQVFFHDSCNLGRFRQFLQEYSAQLTK